MGATEHGQDAHGLALEDQGLAGKCHDSFRLGPLGPADRRVRYEIIGDEDRSPGAADYAPLPDVQRYATEVSTESSPVLVGGVDRPSGARQEVEAARLVWAVGSHRAGRGADVTGGDQPDACERDPGLAGQP